MAALPAVERHDDAVIVGDHLLQGEPPQLAAAVGEGSRNVDRERCLVRLEDRIGPHLVVAIAVIEGDAGEAAAEVAFGQSAVHLVERDDVDRLAAQPLDRLQQEFGRNLEPLVRPKLAAAPRPHVVEHQDRADPFEEGPQQHMGAAEIERVESGANDGRLHGRPPGACSLRMIGLKSLQLFGTMRCLPDISRGAVR